MGDEINPLENKTTNNPLIHLSHFYIFIIIKHDPKVISYEKLIQS